MLDICWILYGSFMCDLVVITGIRTVNPIGLSHDETWENIFNGISGVRLFSCFDVSAKKCYRPSCSDESHITAPSEYESGDL